MRYYPKSCKKYILVLYCNSCTFLLFSTSVMNENEDVMNVRQTSYFFPMKKRFFSVVGKGGTLLYTKNDSFLLFATAVFQIYFTENPSKLYTYEPCVRYGYRMCRTLPPHPLRHNTVLSFAPRHMLPIF